MIKGLTEKDYELIDRLAEKVVKFQLTTPAIFLLEATKPLNVVGSQILVFLGPILTAFFNPDDIYRLSDILEKRETIEEVIVRIERKDEEYFAKLSEERRKRKEEKKREESR
ncbi:MAG: hypothetical protein Kow0090_17890 [Myxococcota bacterium]